MVSTKSAGSSLETAVKTSGDSKLLVKLSCEMKTLYDAALILRKAINESETCIFAGSLDTLCNKHCPEELRCFFRWIIQGPNNTLTDEEKCNEVCKRAMHLAQSTISTCLTEQQLKNRSPKQSPHNWSNASAAWSWCCYPSGHQKQGNCQPPAWLRNGHQIQSSIASRVSNREDRPSTDGKGRRNLPPT